MKTEHLVVIERTKWHRAQERFAEIIKDFPGPLKEYSYLHTYLGDPYGEVWGNRYVSEAAAKKIEILLGPHGPVMVRAWAIQRVSWI